MHGIAGATVAYPPTTAETKVTPSPRAEGAAFVLLSQNHSSLVPCSTQNLDIMMWL